MKFNTITLGCKVNQFETQALESILISKGHVLSGLDEAELIIINTCAVTSESGRKSRQTIRHAMKTNPEALFAICGCFSQLSPDITKELGVDLVSGSGNKQQFVDELEQLYNSKDKKVSVDHALSRREFEKLPAGGLNGRTRALLKIQDGCNNYCSYCIIPYTRGPVRSMKLNDIAEETKRLCGAGFNELVVTGIEISSYGIDFKDGTGLIDAIETISQNAGNTRIRLGSLEPTVVDANFIYRLSKLENICQHFHLALQSGCTDTLKRMRRKYTADQFYEVVENLRTIIPNCGITTDMITGFPGETDEEFSSTLKFIQKCNFSGMHIFPYSRRSGTLADKMENQLSMVVKKKRASEAIAIAKKMKIDYLNQQVGKIMEVLFESQNEGEYSGHSRNYCEVFAKGENLHNVIKKVKIEAVRDESLIGTII